MNNCKIHGVLINQDLIKYKKNKLGEYTYRCKHCMKDLHDKYYAVKKEFVLNQQKEYREQNPERVREIKSISFKKNREKNREKINEKKRECGKKQTKAMADRYMKKLIVKGTNLSCTDIPDSMIKFKRAIMELKNGINVNSINNLGDKLNEDK